MRDNSAKVQAFNADMKQSRERRMATPSPAWKRLVSVLAVRRIKRRLR